MQENTYVMWLSKINWDKFSLCKFFMYYPNFTCQNIGEQGQNREQMQIVYTWLDSKEPSF